MFQVQPEAYDEEILILVNFLFTVTIFDVWSQLWRKRRKRKSPKRGFVTTLSLPRLRNAVTWQEQNLPEEAAPSVNYDGGKKAVCFNHVISAPSIKMLQQKMLHLQTCQTRIMFLLIIKYFTRSVIEKGKRKHSKCGSEFWTWILDNRKLHKDIYTFYLLDDSKC